MICNSSRQPSSRWLVFLCNPGQYLEKFSFCRIMTVEGENVCMNDIQNIMNLLIRYLENNVAPNGFWDNVVEYVLPIFSMLVVIIGGLWTVYTYTKGKNKEENEKILEEVYLPLYQFFVTNDTLAQVGNIEVEYKEDPFYEWSNVKTTITMTIGKTERKEVKSDVLGMTRENFINQMDKINLGLAPEGLVALITSYKAVNYAIEHFTSDKEINQRAIEYRSELEYALRVEAYKGYKKYHKQLGLLGDNADNAFTICDDHIHLSLKPLPERCKKEFEEI